MHSCEVLIGVARYASLGFKDILMTPFMSQETRDILQKRLVCLKDFLSGKTLAPCHTKE
jgi:hypothetical protein